MKGCSGCTGPSHSEFPVPAGHHPGRDLDPGCRRPHAWTRIRYSEDDHDALTVSFCDQTRNSFPTVAFLRLRSESFSRLGRLKRRLWPRPFMPASPRAAPGGKNTSSMETSQIRWKRVENFTGEMPVGAIASRLTQIGRLPGPWPPQPFKLEPAIPHWNQSPVNLGVAQPIY